MKVGLEEGRRFLSIKCCKWGFVNRIVRIYIRIVRFFCVCERFCCKYVVFVNLFLVIIL